MARLRSAFFILSPTLLSLFRFVDIGAGNGDFTAVVAGAAKLEQKALGVEPAAAMVAMNSDAEKVSLLTSSAVDFVELKDLKGTDAGAAWPVRVQPLCAPECLSGACA